MASDEPTLSDSDDAPPCLDEVEAILGYKFSDKGLLEEAFTDSSVLDCLSTYERLEFVGDSVLGTLVAKEQFLRYPELRPGVLTRLRAANVDTEKLARAALKHGLYRYLRHNKPLLLSKIEEFKEAVLEYPLHSNGLIDVPKALADIVESSIGAVFIDSGSDFDTVWKVFRPILEPIIGPEDLKPHPVTELYEMCQKRRMKVNFVDKWAESTSFVVLVDDQLVGSGEYKSKKEIAQNRAAKNALENMEKIFGDNFNISISSN